MSGCLRCGAERERYRKKWCAACAVEVAAEQKREHDRKYREKNREKQKAYYRKWWKENHGRMREYREQNRERRCQQSRQWYAGNREWALEYAREYRRTHKEELEEYRRNNLERWREYARRRRARKKGAYQEPFPHNWNISQWERQRGRCFWDKRHRIAKPGETPRRDERAAHRGHLIALSRDGADTPDNCRLMCAECNQEQHTLSPHEFAPNGQPMLRELLGETGPRGKT